MITVYDVHMSEVTEVEPRVVDPHRLVGISELARHFGLTKSAVSNWASRRDRTDFPAPVTHLAMGPVYDLIEVEQWYRQMIGPIPIPERLEGT